MSSDHVQSRAQFIQECIQGTSFLWQTQTQTIEYGLNDMIQINKNAVMLTLCSFTPSDLNFQTILMPKVNLAKKLSQKSWFLETILILGMLVNQQANTYIAIITW